MGMEQGFAYGFLDNLQLYGEAWLRENVSGFANLVQLAVVLALLVVARLVAPRLRAVTERVARERAWPGGPGRALVAIPRFATAIPWLAGLWLCIAIAHQAGWPQHVLQTAASLASAWVVIGLASSTIRSPAVAHWVAICAWTLAALSTLGLFEASVGLLDSIAITAGSTRISLFTLVKGVAALALLMWLAVGCADLIDRRLRVSPGLSPSLQVLTAKSARVLLLVVAVVVALQTVGIDLTAFAVFSGALGVGIGFGLQRIVANLISGFILLLDHSIKPGDVVTVGDTYGWIEGLGARYVSVRTRDGIEHLIPNEELIVQRVENWSHSDKAVRLRIPIGVSYQADVRQAMQLCLDAANQVDRVLRAPAAVCLLLGFGDSSVDLELRIWISDPEKGRSNVRSAVLLNVWDEFQQHGIEIPYPQRDLHLRTSSLEAGAETVLRAPAADASGNPGN